MKRIWKGLIAAAVVPFAAPPALAQHGGGHGGGGHAGGGHVGGGGAHYGGGGVHYAGGAHYAPAYHSYYAPRYGYGYGTGVGVGLGVGLGLGYGLGYGGYGGGYYGGGYGGGLYSGSSSAYGGYPYSSNSAYLGDPSGYPAVGAIAGSAVPTPQYGAVIPGGQQPAAPTQAAPPSQAATGSAFIEVRVPDGAQVWLGPTVSDQTGPVRTFVSPPLEPGVDYSYLVRGQWTENGVPVTRERKVPVHAGERLTVDLTQPQ